MHFTLKDQEKLMLHMAGELAGERGRRGLRLKYVEAVSFLASDLLEYTRDGKTVAELMELGRKMLSTEGKRWRSRCRREPWEGKAMRTGELLRRSSITVCGWRMPMMCRWQSIRIH